MSTVQVTAKTDLKAFRQAQRKEIAAMLTRGGKICRDAVGVYYRWLAQFAPPSIGSVELKSKKPNTNIYERPAMLLPIAIARGGKHQAQDRAALSQGFAWKVIKKGKPEYFKAGKAAGVPNAVKRARHIVNRGLLRWAFVGVLPNVGVAVPVAMRPLAAKKRGRDLKRNENLVASAHFAMQPQQLLITVKQHVAFASKGNWYGTAERIATENHDAYLRTMLQKFGRTEKR